MDKGKVKSFIILVLLLLDCFLIALLAAERLEAASALRGMENDLAAALERNGLSVAENVDFSKEAPFSRTSSRDLSREAELVSGLLGEVTVSDEGGSIYIYYGERGRASFRGTGDFVIEPAHGSVDIGGGALQTAERLMRKMGIAYARELTETESDLDETTVSFVCGAERPVYNCRVHFSFSASGLVLISGRLAPEVFSAAEGERAINAATALLRFVDIARERGYVCGAINGIDAGFVYDAAASGEGTLTPVWRVDTDAGSYYLNGLTGAAEINI